MYLYSNLIIPRFWWLFTMASSHKEDKRNHIRQTCFVVWIETMWCQRGLPNVQQQWRLELKYCPPAEEAFGDDQRAMTWIHLSKAPNKFKCLVINAKPFYIEKDSLKYFYIVKACGDSTSTPLHKNLYYILMYNYIVVLLSRDICKIMWHF